METTTTMVWLYLLVSSSTMSPTADNATEATVVDNVTASPNHRTSSSSSFVVDRSVGQAFNIAGIVIAVVGTIANGYVLLALTLSKNSSKSNVNVFIAHQTILDLTASVFRFIGAMLNTVGNRTIAVLVCSIFKSYTISISASHASVCGLVIITIERYFKIVHPVAHRNKYRPWMTRAGIIIPWIFGFATDFIPTVATTGIVGGKCIRNNLWSNNGLKIAWAGAKFLLLYLLPLTILVFSYWKILAVIRRQRMKVGQSQQQTGTTISQAETDAQKNSRRIEMNVVKTMLLVSMAFVLCFGSLRTYAILVKVDVVARDVSLYNLFALFHYSSQCLNPFIYATQYDVVKRTWKVKACRMVCGQKVEEAPTSAPVLTPSSRKRQSTKIQ